MNKTITVIISVIMAVCCITAVAVSAADTAGTPTSQEIPKTAVNTEKVYFSYYNTGSDRGAIAFCLDNKFTSYGTGEGKIQICRKSDDGATFVSIYTVEKSSVNTWFYGKTEHSVTTDPDAENLLGGLSSVGITFDSKKTNVCLALRSQNIEAGKSYYIYIPENYFLDEAGNPNAGAYIEITSDITNNYTGNLLEDLQKLTSGIYDAALFGIESVGGILF